MLLPQRHISWASPNFLQLSLLFPLSLFILRWEESSGLVQITSFHQLYQVVPSQHAQLHFLNMKRLKSPELIFWNGIGAMGETVLILASATVIGKHTPDFLKQNLNLTVKYNSVKMTYVEHIGDDKAPVKPKKDEAHSLEDFEMTSMADPVPIHDEAEDIENKLARGEPLNDQYEAEQLISKRKHRFEKGIFEAGGDAPLRQGLLGAIPIEGVSGQGSPNLPIYSGLLYRIQGVQTLSQYKETTPDKSEWPVPSNGGRPMGKVPHVGEFFAASFNKKRGGTNPFLTSEENKQRWRNDEYKSNKTKSVLWIFVPTEFDKFYEIRNRNFPASLVVWKYDVEEREFVLTIETRKEYMKRYKPEGVLRHRALFSFQLVSESFPWELRQGRPKFQLITYQSNHIYSYASKKKRCILLIVRNSASEPYAPPITEKMNRQLDMFYITRLNLTGKYTASIYSFVYEQSIVDAYEKSEDDRTIKELAHFELANRGPIKFPHYVEDEVPSINQYTYQFKDTFKNFQWVTVEAHVPSFGVAPVIQAGLVGNNTNTNQITRKIQKNYKIQDKVVIPSGYSVNATVIFQSVKDFVNPFTALMEVTEPVDRLYWDDLGKPKFIRFSMPGSFIEKTWNGNAEFTYERVIEKTEASLVVLVRGTLKASYGLRAFLKEVQVPYGDGIVACESYS